MILLTSVSDALQLITASAVANINVHASWVDNNAGALTPGRTNSVISTAATTSIVSSPASGVQRNLQSLTVFNSHASSSNLVTLQHTDGTTVAPIFKYTLGAGEMFEWVNGQGLRVYDSSGSVKTSVATGTDNKNQINFLVSGTADSYIKADTAGYLLFARSTAGAFLFEYLASSSSIGSFITHTNYGANSAAAITAYSTEVHSIVNATAGAETGKIDWQTLVAGVSAIRMSLLNGGLKMAAGSATIAPFTLTAGTNLSTAAAGVFEYDGDGLYFTNDITNGRNQVAQNNYFRLTGSGTGITTIADFFGINSAIPLVAGGIYEIEWQCYFSQVTAGTGTWTIVSTNALQSLTSEYVGSPIAGIGAVGTPQTAGVNVTASTATALPVTGTEATGATHYFKVKAILQANATTGGNTRLRLTMGAGTATPLINSIYYVRRLDTGNVGTFVA